MLKGLSDSKIATIMCLDLTLLKTYNVCGPIDLPSTLTLDMWYPGFAFIRKVWLAPLLTFTLPLGAIAP